MCSMYSNSLERLFDLIDVDLFNQELFDVAEKLGFSGISVALENSGTGELKMVTNFALGYIELYQKNNFHLYDHVLAHCRKYDTPVNWQDSYPISTLSEKSKEVISTSADFGIVTGLAVPVSGHIGRGLVSLQFDGSRKELIEYSNSHLLSTVGFCQSVMWKMSRSFPSQLHEPPRLTQMESECLKYVSDGLSNREIASVLSVSVDRIKELVSSLLKKLEAANRTEAVMQAFRFHLI